MADLTQILAVLQRQLGVQEDAGLYAMPVLPVAPQQGVRLPDYLLELLPPPDPPDQPANTVVQRFVEENHCKSTTKSFVCQAVSNTL